ncbi:MAG: homoserine dehydrogenase [Candidatus Puniceispirillaceae bacterium]
MQECRIAIAGLGVVGAETARQLVNRQSDLSDKAGQRLTITAISARSKDKDRGFDMSQIAWCDNPVDLASRDDVDVIVELMGGSDGPALELCKTALQNGKHVVTANKAMIALHGTELAELAESNNASLCFEAAVAGGIPALKILREGLAANDIHAVSGILNGTCNYILSEMESTGRSFDDVLAEAQQLGYAEANPTFDVDGIDAAHKLTILDALAFGRAPDFDAVTVKGIRQISDVDIAFAEELGYRIRLVGRATKDGQATVAPVLLPETSHLAKVTGALNAVHYEAEPVNIVSATGPGAGAGPTASAVLSDLIDIVSGRHNLAFGKPANTLGQRPDADNEASETAYYIRLMVLDQPGVLSSVTDILKQQAISIESLIQKGRHDNEAVALVMVLHETSHHAVAAACQAFEDVEAIKDVAMTMPVVA